ncbi:hypothetical protein [Vibrio europaeus]|uniref:hypothetical protein n=1 Tax=Vibrio europaeus TaxID=300876 RepID=UPI0039E1D2E9
MIHFKEPKGNMDVIVFGKNKEQELEDIQNGISRFGGGFRQPSYSFAYFKSAKVLLENAVSNNELDELGLPIFYMVRHSFELNLKGLLGMAYEILKMRHELYGTERTEVDLPSGKQLKRFETSHELDKLYRDLVTTCKLMDVSIPTEVFDTVLESILRFEVAPTWSRYHSSNKGLHVADEVALPIVQIVNDLETLFSVVTYDTSGSVETIESVLYSEFNSLIGRLENSEC